MKDGKVQQFDTPLNLYNYPANKFVAGFIGSPSMNFIEGKIIESENITFQSKLGSLSFRIPEKYSKLLSKYKSNSVWLGIRPEDINLKTTNDFSAEDKFEIDAEVNLIEPLGNQLLIYFKCEDEQFIAEHRGFIQISKGSKEKFLLNLNRLSFFDKTTEERIS
jgi:multiple sugar transport system ATP-binding protein